MPSFPAWVRRLHFDPTVAGLKWRFGVQSRAAGRFEPGQNAGLGVHMPFTVGD